MRSLRQVRRLFAITACVALTATGCAFGGLNSLPLPGAVGHGSGDYTYHVELANVGSLESNSPVLLGNVVVGSVGRMTTRDWHADVEVAVKSGVVIPANAVATVGQTSLLGSMHLALDPPLGQPPTGRLQPGSTLGLKSSSTYPSTEQTLSALSVVVNGGGLGQIGDVIREFNAALTGHQDQIRDLLLRLNDVVGLLAAQRDNINASVTSLNRLAGTFAEQREVITAALDRIPPALDVLINQRPQIVSVLTKFGKFADLANGLVNDVHSDLVRDLTNLEPTVRALADVGPQLDTVLAYVPTLPYSQDLIDRAVRGDYLNNFVVFDLTVPRLKRGLFLGTRWGQEGAPLVPAPGDPWYATYTYDPLKAPLSPTPTAVASIPPLLDPAAAPADEHSAPADTGEGPALGSSPEPPLQTAPIAGADAPSATPDGGGS